MQKFALQVCWNNNVFIQEKKLTPHLQGNDLQVFCTRVNIITWIQLKLDVMSIQKTQRPDLHTPWVF